MGDGMTTRESAALDNHITGGGSPGLADGVENFGAPILLAWAMLDKQHSPLAAEITEAINKAIDEDGYKSVTAITLLKSYFRSTVEADVPQKKAYEEFARGWEAGAACVQLDTPSATEDTGWENEHFSYMLGHLAGDFASDLDWATPFEKEDDVEDGEVE
jgi:hypothetical protein